MIINDFIKNFGDSSKNISFQITIFSQNKSLILCDQNLKFLIYKVKNKLLKV